MDYSVVRVMGFDHVVCSVPSRKSLSFSGNLPDANYMNTGKALCGILRKGETLDEWIKNITKKGRRENNFFP